MANPTIEAILGYTDDPQLQASMALGARLEGGWSPPFGVGDGGTSFGPYQIHLPAHPGVTAAEASDPQWATSYMGHSYSSALAAVGPGAFDTGAESAAETVADRAERPAQDYVAARGQAAVDSAWAATMIALPPTTAAALHTSGGSSSSTFPAEPGLTYPYPNPTTTAQANADAKALAAYLANKDVGGTLPSNPITSAAKGAVNAVDSGLATAFGAIWDDAKPFLTTMGFVVLGLGLVGAGLVISTRGARSTSTTTGNLAGLASEAALA